MSGGHWRQKVWTHLHCEFGLSLLESEMDQIEEYMVEYYRKELVPKSDLSKLIEEMERADREPEGYPRSNWSAPIDIDRYWAGRLRKIIGGE